MRKNGYTLIEVLIASSLAVLVIGGVTTSMAHVIRTWRETRINSELNINLETAMEHMRQDMRLSSVGVGLMSFYPAESVHYTALSFPMADDLDGDGLLDRDNSGKIKWTKTVIYHVLGTSPNEFRRTLFSNRSTTSTPDALYQQLKSVAEATSEAGIINAAMAGETCNSRTIFRNLSRLSFYPPKSMFDGYAPTRQHGSTFNFGSIVLDPGFHTLTFTVTGKNRDSSGFDVEVDRFRLGRARGALEGEIFIPKNSHPRAPLFGYSLSGGSVSAEDMSSYGVEWSGNAQANFNAAGVGSEINFEIYDDMWCDSNFNDPGAQISSNCSVKWDLSLNSIAPYIGDKVVSMDKGIAWSATACGDTEYILPVSNSITAYNIVYGGGLLDDMSIALNGCWTRLYFDRPEGCALNLHDVRISDLTTGASEPVTFNNGSSSITIPATGERMIISDWIELWEIDRQRSYVIQLTSTPQYPGAWGLACQVNTDGVNLSWVNGSWEAYTAGIHSLEVGYPKEAVYRSGIFDTRCATPAYKKLYWTQIENFSKGGDLDVRIRSGNDPELADGNWLDAYPNYDGYFQYNSGSSLSMMPKKRYVQYEAKFRCGHSGHIDAHTNAPTAILRDVSILWTPPMGLVDLEVDFGMGPGCGIVEATVDGKTLAKSMVVELEIYKKGPRAMQTAHAKTEIKPLNTGK